MPMLLWGALGLGTLIAGYFRYEQIKVGDLLQVQLAAAAGAATTATVKVTGINGQIITGTVIDPATNTDTKVPVSIQKSNVVKNLTPRFMG